MSTDRIKEVEAYCSLTKNNAKDSYIAIERCKKLSIDWQKFRIYEPDSLIWLESWLHTDASFMDSLCKFEILRRYMAYHPSRRNKESSRCYDIFGHLTEEVKRFNPLGNVEIEETTIGLLEEMGFNYRKFMLLQSLSEMNVFWTFVRKLEHHTRVAEDAGQEDIFPDENYCRFLTGFDS